MAERALIFMNYNNIINEIFSYESKGIVLGLERMQQLMGKLGNPEKGTPEKRMRYIHVSGTNGKGSVSAMCAAILQEAGYKVGLYTSPHLYDVKERIRINKTIISKDDFISAYLKIKPHITNQTFFEILTAMAFQQFYDENVDFVVLEVGLGGMFDATNIIDNSLVSIITNVELDHLQYLGNTREKIAAEKAGIIKQNSIFITGIDKDDAVFAIFEEKAKQQKTSIIQPAKIDDVKNGFKHTTTNLHGEFQKSNAMLAKKAIMELANYGINISEEIIDKGLLNVDWPGRFQFISDNIIIDCAHNPAGIECICKEISRLKQEKGFEKIIIVFGVMKDKQYESMIQTINDVADILILTHIPIDRALFPEELIEYISKEYYLTNDPNEAFAIGKQMLKESKEKSLLLVCGSCYLIGCLKINDFATS